MAEQQATSEEIARLVDADQAARTNMSQTPDWEAIGVADRQRRERAAQLFASGCLSTPKDYGAAALIFQHGQVPEHYMAAFFFASRAVALGDASYRGLMAVAVDRYLSTTGHRQLFGSQFQVRHGASCECRVPVEPGFSDEERRVYGRGTLEEQRRDIEQAARVSFCVKLECDGTFLPTPKGSIPGIW